MSVCVNPPKTPVTEGSNGIAAATIPNVCKMPGPPAPFVPTPLPNIGKSGMSPKGYSKKVTIEGNKVAIKGATFGSMGDVASKGTGGGIVSMNCEGPTAFLGPGSMNVKIEGKNVQLLGDPMLNNCGPSGSPANAATMQGVIQLSGLLTAVMAGPCPICGRDHGALCETSESKASAQGLANAWREKKGKDAMLGVAHCKKCNRKYGEKSGTTDERFCRAADAAGCIHQDVARVREAAQASGLNQEERATAIREEPFRRRLGDHFQRLAQRGDDMHREYLDDTQNRPSANVPFACSAQKLIVLMLDKGGIPGSMTEQWYSAKGRRTAQILHFDHRIPANRLPSTLPSCQDMPLPGPDPDPSLPLLRTFAHGDTVPPCKTCSLILPYLLCTDKTECSD